MMVTVPAWGEAQGLDSPLTVSIQMTKSSYALQEEIDGLVVITNASPSSFPAIFDIQLFREDILVESVSVAIKSFLPGANKYNLKELGIPQIDPKGEGRWRITSRQKDVDDSYAAEAEFVIFSPHE